MDKRRKIHDEPCGSKLLELPLDILNVITNYLNAYISYSSLARTCKYLSFTVWRGIERLDLGYPNAWANWPLTWETFAELAPKLLLVRRLRLIINREPDDNLSAEMTCHLVHLTKVHIEWRQPVGGFKPIQTFLGSLPSLSTLKCPQGVLAGMPTLLRLKTLTIEDCDRTEKVEIVEQLQLPMLEKLRCFAHLLPDFQIDVSNLKTLKDIMICAARLPDRALFITLPGIVGILAQLPNLESVTLPSHPSSFGATGGNRQLYISDLAEAVLSDVLPHRIRSLIARCWFAVDKKNLVALPPLLLYAGYSVEAMSIVQSSIYDITELLKVPHRQHPPVSMLTMLTGAVDQFPVVIEWVRLLAKQSSRVRSLLESSNEYDRNVLCSVTRHVDHVRLFEEVLKVGFDPEQCDSGGLNSLEYALGSWMVHGDLQSSVATSRILLGGAFKSRVADPSYPRLKRLFQLVTLDRSGAVLLDFVNAGLLPPPTPAQARSVMKRYKEREVNQAYQAAGELYKALRTAQPEFRIDPLDPWWSRLAMSAIAYKIGQPPENESSLEYARWLLTNGVSPSVSVPRELGDTVLHTIMLLFNTDRRYSFARLIRAIPPHKVDLKVRNALGQNFVDRAFASPCTIEVLREVLRAGICIGQDGMDQLARLVVTKRGEQYEQFYHCLVEGIAPGPARKDRIPAYYTLQIMGSLNEKAKPIPPDERPHNQETHSAFVRDQQAEDIKTNAD